MINRNSLIRNLFLASLIITAGGAFTVCFNYPFGSDEVQIAMYFYDISENGNYFLRCWYLTDNSFLFTNFSIYIVLGFIFGMGHLVLKAGAFLAFSVSVCVFSYVVYKAWDGKTAMLYSILAAGASPAALELILRPYSRMGTITFSFLSVAVLYHLAGKPSGIKKAALSALIFCLPFLASFSDPYLMISFTVPAIAAYLTLRIGGRRLYDTKNEALYACLAITGTLGGKSIAGLNLAGPTILGASAPMGPIELCSLPEHLFFFLDRLSYLFGLSGPKAIVTAPLFILFLISSYILFKRTENAWRAFLVRYMIFFFMFLSAAFILKEKELAPALARYLIPIVFVYSFVFASAIAGEKIFNGLRLYAVSLLLVLSLVINLHGAYSYSRPESRLKGLASFMDESGMKYGYAEYWEANVITFYSGNKVKSRPVKASRKDVLVPYLWFSKSTWYTASEWNGPTFLILADGERLGERDSSILGAPSRILNYDSYTIMEWPFNIMVRLIQEDGTDARRAHPRRAADWQEKSTDCK